MSSNGDLFKGFVLGGLVGLAAGILFAPKSGKDTRKEILDEGDELLEKAKSELDKLKIELFELKDKISETIDRGKNAFEKAQTKEEMDFEEGVNSMDDEIAEPETEKKTSTRSKAKAKKA